MHHHSSLKKVGRLGIVSTLRGEKTCPRKSFGACRACSCQSHKMLRGFLHISSCALGSVALLPSKPYTEVMEQVLATNVVLHRISPVHESWVQAAFGHIFQVGFVYRCCRWAALGPAGCDRVQPPVLHRFLAEPFYTCGKTEGTDFFRAEDIFSQSIERIVLPAFTVLELSMASFAEVTLQGAPLGVESPGHAQGHRQGLGTARRLHDLPWGRGQGRHLVGDSDLTIFNQPMGMRGSLPEVPHPKNVVSRCWNFLGCPGMMEIVNH